MIGLDYLEELKESAKLPVDYEKIIESDDLLLNLDIIKLRVFKVTMFALAHEKPFIKEVIDAMEESRSSGNLLSYYTERLPSKDLFDCLRMLDSDCLWIVLERLKTYHINLIENLVDAVLNNNYEGYKIVLNENEINTEPITPISKILYTKIRIDKSLVNSFEGIQNLESMDDEEVPEKYRNLLLRSISETKSIMGEIKNSKDSNDVYESVERIIVDSDFVERVKNETAPFKERYMGFVIKNLKRDFPSIKEKGLTYEEYLNYVYMGLLQDYCEGIAGFPSLSTYAKLVIENILKSELFKTAWNGYDKFNENTYYDLDARMDEFCGRFGLVEEEDEESRLMMGSNEGHIIDSTKKRQLDTRDSDIQNFKDSTPHEKAKELYDVVLELLNEIEGREGEFLSDDYILNDLKNVFRDILIMDAGENIDTQRAIIEELAATEREDISDLYYHKNRLWLQPFFIIIGHLYNKGILIGGQKNIC